MTVDPHPGKAAANGPLKQSPVVTSLATGAAFRHSVFEQQRGVEMKRPEDTRNMVAGVGKQPMAVAKR
jgi:hypothetical protein